MYSYLLLAVEAILIFMIVCHVVVDVVNMMQKKYKIYPMVYGFLISAIFLLEKIN